MRACAWATRVGMWFWSVPAPVPGKRRAWAPRVGLAGCVVVAGASMYRGREKGWPCRVRVARVGCAPEGSSGWTKKAWTYESRMSSAAEKGSGTPKAGRAWKSKVGSRA